MADAVLIYLAGAFDGEGTITFNVDKKANTTSCLQVVNTDWRLPVMFELQFGGSLTFTNPGQKKAQVLWSVSGKQAESAAEALLPFLVLKAEQMHIWLEARKLIGKRGRGHRGNMSRKLNMQDIEERVEVFNELAALKHVSFNDVIPGSSKEEQLVYVREHIREQFFS
jgi:phosphotransferase system HPr-like phosphotransfer protein